jgi:hypothetical protein
MKNKSRILPAPRHLVIFLALGGVLAAAPLTETTAVHTKPDTASPAFTFLKAGTEPVAAAGMSEPVPAGWMAIDVPGPFQAYVQVADLTKTLDPKPGVPIRVAPKPDGAVLATSEKDDKVTLTGTVGRWAQITLEKNIVGYIKIGGTPPNMTLPQVNPPAAPSPTPDTPTANANANAPAASTVTAPGHPAPAVDNSDGGASALPRQFAGKFVSTRRPFTPRRPYDWALNDDAGKRFAYLDISKLLLTEQIEKYIDHPVVVFGTARPVPDTKDIVIQVETLQLK